ncbi:unnamed protein product [Effrenium voratum]|nr:unnamed protein product [Effrenium voratum]
MDASMEGDFQGDDWWWGQVQAIAKARALELARIKDVQPDPTEQMRVEVEQAPQPNEDASGDVRDLATDKDEVEVQGLARMSREPLASEATPSTRVGPLPCLLGQQGAAWLDHKSGPECPIAECVLEAAESCTPAADKAACSTTASSSLDPVPSIVFGASDSDGDGLSDTLTPATREAEDEPEAHVEDVSEKQQQDWCRDPWSDPDYKAFYRFMLAEGRAAGLPRPLEPCVEIAKHHALSQNIAWSQVSFLLSDTEDGLEDGLEDGGKSYVKAGGRARGRLLSGPPSL